MQDCTREVYANNSEDGDERSPKGVHGAAIFELFKVLTQVAIAQKECIESSTTPAELLSFRCPMGIKMM